MLSREDKAEFIKRCKTLVTRHGRAQDYNSYFRGRKTYTPYSDLQISFSDAQHHLLVTCNEPNSVIVSVLHTHESWGYGHQDVVSELLQRMRSLMVSDDLAST